MTGYEWVAAFAERLGVEAPDDAVMAELLALAGTAAHSSERTAAPIACYLVGLTGRSVAAAHEVARTISGTKD